MANPDKPQFHSYQDALNDDNHKVSNYNELLRRAKLKKEDEMKTKAWIAEQAKIDDFVTIKPSAELALVDHYSAMPEVEMDPEVKTVWESEQDSLGKLDLQTPQNEYMQAYNEWQHYVEMMDVRKRENLGINSIDKEEENAKKGIKDAKENLKEARKRVGDVKNEVTPFSVMLGALTGANKDAKTFMDAKKGVKKAKKSLKDAHQRLDEVRQRRALIQEKQDELGVKEAMALEKMNTALERMADNQKTAAELDANVKKYADSLHAQYAVIDKFKSMQSLKQKALNDVSTRNLLKAENPDLFNALEGLPDTLPEKAFKITLAGPIQLPDNSSKMADLDSKIEDVKKKLPAGIDLDNLPDEIEKYKIKEGETIADIDAEMRTITDHDSEDYKRLSMKKGYLEAKQKLDNCQTLIDQFKKDIVNATSEKDRQIALRKLSNQQQIYKILKEDLDKNPYSQMMAQFQELQSLMEQKEKLGIVPTTIEDLDRMCEQAEACEVLTRNDEGTELPLSTLYQELIKKLKEQKENALKKLEEKHKKLPLERAEDETERDSDDGAR